MPLPNPTLPLYTITLPASNQQVQFRPFTVNEEKILLLAMEEDLSERLAESLDQIFDLCTFGKCRLKNMVQVDAEYLFIKIRNKSLGEGLDVSHNCSGCNFTTEITLNLDDITIISPNTKSDGLIKIDDNTIVQLSYPSLDKTIALNDGADPILALAKCTDSIFMGESTYSKEDVKLSDYVDYYNKLPQLQIDTLNEFFKTMPRIVFDYEYTCLKCGAINNMHMEGLNDFFE